MKLPSKDFFDFDIYNINEISFLADELKKQQLPILVLGEEIKEDEIQLLYKIMKAVDKQVEGDFLLLDIAKQESTPNFQSLSNMLVEQGVLLVFGISPSKIGLHLKVKPYQIVRFQSYQLLFGHELTAIATNVNYKKQLWGQLQQLFK